MGRKQFKPEQIIRELREAEIKRAGGKTTRDVCRELGQPRSTLRSMFSSKLSLPDLHDLGALLQ